MAARFNKVLTRCKHASGAYASSLSGSGSILNISPLVTMPMLKEIGSGIVLISLGSLSCAEVAGLFRRRNTLTAEQKQTLKQQFNDLNILALLSGISIWILAILILLTVSYFWPKQINDQSSSRAVLKLLIAASMGTLFFYQVVTDWLFYRKLTATDIPREYIESRKRAIIFHDGGFLLIILGFVLIMWANQ